MKLSNEGKEVEVTEISKKEAADVQSHLEGRLVSVEQPKQLPYLIRVKKVTYGYRGEVASPDEEWLELLGKQTTATIGGTNIPIRTVFTILS